MLLVTNIMILLQCRFFHLGNFVLTGPFNLHRLPYGNPFNSFNLHHNETNEFVYWYICTQVCYYQSFGAMQDEKCGNRRLFKYNRCVHVEEMDKCSCSSQVLESRIDGVLDKMFNCELIMWVLY